MMFEERSIRQMIETSISRVIVERFNQDLDERIRLLIRDEVRTQLRLALRDMAELTGINKS